MIITLNCDWNMPGESISAAESDQDHGIGAMNAVLGINWQPKRACNDNHLLSLHRVN